MINVYPIINHYDYLLMLVVMINGEMDINGLLYRMINV